MEFVLLIIGFIVLLKGADYFVEGSSKIAQLLKLPPILIGLTIVAFGTSSPEATVSISAALKNSGDITLGNVLGSNIFNISFVLGVAALILPLKVERETMRKQIPFALLGSVALIILISDKTLQSFSQISVAQGDGLILLTFFSVFLYYIYGLAKNSMENMIDLEEDEDKNSTKMGMSIAYTIGGLVALILGGELVVRNAIKIAYLFGMSETLVGLTIVSVGTSLPELITSVTAALNGKVDIILGNVVGSNIFNILFILGISSAITPVNVQDKMITDSYIMIFLTIGLLCFSASKSRISRREGLALVISYLIYTGYIIIRN